MGAEDRADAPGDRRLLELDCAVDPVGVGAGQRVVNPRCAAASSSASGLETPLSKEK